MNDSDILDGGDPEALLEAVERKKQLARKQPPRNRALERKASVADSDSEVAVKAAPDTRRARKRLAAKRQPISTDTLGEDSGVGKRRASAPARPARSLRPGRVGPWSIAACAAAVAILALTVDALGQTPKPLPVSNVTITWLPGPQLPTSEVLSWMRKFPGRAKISNPDSWVLDQLTAYLRALPAVAEVRQLRLIHEPDGKSGTRRSMELVMALRQPAMPAVLATGERVWVDREGRVLPGVLPAPAVKRPNLRGIEAAGTAKVQAALAMWHKLEPQLERNLVTDIVLNDLVDERGNRGIVLYTRQGSRLVWGDPAEERYGVRVDDKARDLVHTIRCQGDLGRIAMINVRFNQPFFVLRD
ncbi:MAG: cell division protein FtsQ [Planctomycetes bacterium]|nr:cell division protein FtsQ [Planctomycetota bacterium]